MSEATNQPSVFRSAAEPTTDKPADKPIVDASTGVETHIDDLVATYESDQGKPYVAKYFDIESVWDEQPELKRDIQEIEGYIRSQVSADRVDNSTKAAKEFLKDIERKAGLTRYESTNQRITKVLAYIDFQRTVHG